MRDSTAQDYLDFGRYFDQGRPTVLAIVEAPKRCPECDKIYPDLGTLRTSYAPRGVRIIVVMVNTGLASWFANRSALSTVGGSWNEAAEDSVAAYVAARHLRVPVALVGGGENKSYQPRHTKVFQPTLVVIDRAGRIRLQLEGWTAQSRMAIAHAMDQILATTVLGRPAPGKGLRRNRRQDA